MNKPTPAPPVDPATLPDDLPEDERAYMARPRRMFDSLPPHHARHAVRQTLGTMMQAHQAFDAAAEALGERGFVDPSGERADRRLHLRDPDDPRAVFARVFVHLRSGGSAMMGPAIRTTPPGTKPVVPIDAPEGWTPDQPRWDLPERRIDILPKGPDMHGGKLKLRDGPSFFELVYDNDGRQAETVEHGGDFRAAWLFGATRPWQLDPNAARPQDPPIRLLLRKDLDVHGWPAARMGAAIAEMADSNHCPARVLMPVPVPGGPLQCWINVKRAVARHIAGVDADWTGWMALDGLRGEVVVTAETREEAEAACRARIEAERPTQRRPEPFDPEKAAAEANAVFAKQDEEHERAIAQIKAEREAKRRGEGGVVSLDEQRLDPQTGEIKDRRGKTVGGKIGQMNMVLRGTESAIEWPEDRPEHAPIVLVPVPRAAALPDAWRAAGFATQQRLLGDDGRMETAFIRETDDGFIAVGARIAERIDPGLIEHGIPPLLDEVDARFDDAPPEFAAIRITSPAHLVRFGNPPGRRSALRFAGSSRRKTFARWELGAGTVDEVAVCRGLGG